MTRTSETPHLCQEVIKLRFKSRTSRIPRRNANYKTGLGSVDCENAKNKKCPQSKKYELSMNLIITRMSFVYHVTVLCISATSTYVIVYAS